METNITFTQQQIDEYKKKLHTKIHWLLLYRDKKVIPELANAKQVDLNTYFASIIDELNTLNRMLNYPDGMIELLTKLDQAWHLNNDEKFNFKQYRKHILDAHTLVDALTLREVTP